jgi:hypothetical protein
MRHPCSYYSYDNTRPSLDPAGNTLVSTWPAIRTLLGSRTLGWRRGEDANAADEVRFVTQDTG